jgi:sugar lactone lactonase YvrE
MLGQVAAVPDGISLDAEGAVWVADAAHSRLIRVAEGGHILEERKTDGVGVFACMLGGDDRRTLFASVAPTFHEAAASANHHAAILMTTVEVPHAGLPQRVRRPMSAWRRGAARLISPLNAPLCRNIVSVPVE